LVWSVRLYRLLLRAYPASFRRRYAGEMAEVFGDMAEAAVERRGGVGLIGLWVRVVPDLLLTAVGQQLAETERRVAMWRQFWGGAHLPAALTLALLLAALATPADPASMLIAVVPIFGVYVAALASTGLGPRGRALAILASILHAALWIAVISNPATLLLPPDPAQLSATDAFLIYAGLVFLPWVTTAALVGVVALVSRVVGGSGRPGEDTEIAA
jgi:hypothetical protein